MSGALVGGGLGFPEIELSTVAVCFERSFFLTPASFGEGLGSAMPAEVASRAERLVSFDCGGPAGIRKCQHLCQTAKGEMGKTEK